MIRVMTLAWLPHVSLVAQTALGRADPSLCTAQSAGDIEDISRISAAIDYSNSQLLNITSNLSRHTSETSAMITEHQKDMAKLSFAHAGAAHRQHADQMAAQVLESQSQSPAERSGRMDQARAAAGDVVKYAPPKNGKVGELLIVRMRAAYSPSPQLTDGAADYRRRRFV